MTIHTFIVPGHAHLAFHNGMAFTRKQSKEKPKYTFVKSEYVASEADSTVAHWGPASSQAPRRKAKRSEPVQHGVDWQNLPDGPLLRIFEILNADEEGTADMHNAAAACTQWREAFYEVTLGDTAASRPERPPLAVTNNVKKEPPATTATTCAAVCEASKSETNGFEACSNRRQLVAARSAAATVAARLGCREVSLPVGSLPAAAVTDVDAQAAATAAAAQEDNATGTQAPSASPLQQRLRRRTLQHAAQALQQQQRRRRHSTPATGDTAEQQQQHAVPASAATRRRSAPAAAADGHNQSRHRAGIMDIHPSAAAAAGTHTLPSLSGRKRTASKRLSDTEQHELEQHPLAAAAEAAAAAGQVHRRHRPAPARAVRQHVTGNDSEGADALTDEVVQPTTAQAGDTTATHPATAARQYKRRAGEIRPRVSLAAAAQQASQDVALQRQQADSGRQQRRQQQEHAAASSPRRHRQHRHEHPPGHQQQEQEQPRQHQRADSTEAVAQGDAVGQQEQHQQQGQQRPGRRGAGGSPGRQTSGSNRPASSDHWFGGLFSIPSWFRRGGSH